MVTAGSNVADQMKSLTYDVISSYEDRLSSIESIFSDTHQMLDDFQKALFETREERDSLSSELRQKLSKTESLRHKDFDQMMQGIQKELKEREKEVRGALEKYIAEQKEVAGTLKEGLADFNKQLVKGEQIRVEDFKQKFAEIKRQQLERQNQVRAMLEDFQVKVGQYRKENEELAKEIRELLSKGEAIRIRDFKRMLRDIKDRQKEREKEVEGMLNEYGAEHKEAAQAWQALSSAMAKKRLQAKEVMSIGK